MPVVMDSREESIFHAANREAPVDPSVPASQYAHRGTMVT
jgi:hypothetical protein